MFSRRATKQQQLVPGMNPTGAVQFPSSMLENLYSLCLGEAPSPIPSTFWSECVFTEAHAAPTL